MSQSGIPAAAVRDQFVLTFNSPAAAPAAGPSAGLAAGESTLSPVSSPAEGHVALGAAVEFDPKKLGTIHDYATDKKHSIGFLGWKYFQAKKLAKEYLTRKGVDLKQIMPNMPWNASRSLCVLCMLVEKGLSADQIHTLFMHKEDVEAGRFDVRLGEGVTYRDLAELANCQTPTFLWRVATRASGEELLIRLRAVRYEQPSAEEEEALPVNIEAATKALALVEQFGDGPITDPRVPVLFPALCKVMRYGGPIQQKEAAIKAVALVNKFGDGPITDPEVLVAIFYALGWVLEIDHQIQGFDQQAANKILHLTSLHDDASIAAHGMMTVLFAALKNVITYGEPDQKQRAADEILRLVTTINDNTTIRADTKNYIKMALDSAREYFTSTDPTQDEKARQVQALIDQFFPGAPAG